MKKPAAIFFIGTIVLVYSLMIAGLFRLVFGF